MWLRAASKKMGNISYELTTKCSPINNKKENGYGKQGNYSARNNEKANHSYW